MEKSRKSQGIPLISLMEYFYPENPSI